MTSKETALLFKHNYATSCIPVNADKTPRFKWSAYQNNLPSDLEISQWFSADSGIAVIAGKIQCIDFDEKYSPKIFEKFYSLCLEHGLDSVLQQLVIQKTPSGGFHAIFKCEDNERCQKLAMTSDGKVAIETRASGGYFIVAPSKGYLLTQNSFENIPTISAEEREELFTIARFFNKKPKEQIYYDNVGNSPGDDFDSRGDITELLKSHGWAYVGKKSWRRPGKSRGISATWDHIPNRFYVFSSSTEFEVGHSYKPWHVFAILQCGGDYKKAAAELSKLGYGKKHSPTISTTNRPYSTISKDSVLTPTITSNNSANIANNMPNSRDISQVGGKYSRDSGPLSHYSKNIVGDSNNAQTMLENAKLSLQNLDDKKNFKINEITPEDIWNSPIDPMSDCLLGNRFLCQDGSWLLVASSGVGKSVLAMQMALNFALGRVLWGLDPHKPKKVILIQAENNDLDLREPFLSISKQMKLSSPDKKVIQKNLHILSEDVLIAKDFIDYLHYVHEKYSPDIVIIDPLLSYIGADVSRQDVCSIFLRNQLNPILHKFHSGIIIIHHTGKPIKDKDFTLSDLAYLGMGSSELTNWARAVSVVKQNADNNDVYELIHTKRGKRSGANIITYLKHSEEGICWEETWKPTSSQKPKQPRISKYDHLGLEDTPPLKHNTNDATKSELISHIVSRLKAVGDESSNENAVRVYNCVRRLTSPILKQLEDGRWVGRSYLPTSEGELL